jgi:hypothetical protein
MNEQENNKANAAILLSADEAVEKKIIAVLTKHPHIIRQALDTIERERLAQQAQQYQNALGQSMVNTKQQVAQNVLGGTYTSNNTNPLGQIAQNTNPHQGVWGHMFGGKK